MRERIKQSLAHLAVALPLRNMSEGEASAFWKMYIEDIEHLPIDVIEETCKKIRKKQKFFPVQMEFLKQANDIMRYNQSVLQIEEVEIKALPSPTIKDQEYRRKKLAQSKIESPFLRKQLERLI
tara:strand:- start:1656 stop:2027 length:372 start_codon:yes stop_codon:yes gene_type:complete